MRTYEETIARYEERGYVETQTGNNWAVVEKGRAKQPVNHLLHIVLIVLTLGFWMSIYAIILIVDTFTPGQKRYRITEHKPGRVRVRRI